MRPYHLFGADGDLLYRPAVFVNSAHTFRFEFERYCQQPGYIKVRIINGVDIKCLVFLIWLSFVQHQIAPNLCTEFISVLDPSIGFVWSSCFQSFVFVLAWQWTHLGSVDWLAPFEVFS